MPALEPAPRTPIVDGNPAFGTYRGSLESTAFEARRRGAGRLSSILREKHWQWFAAADDEVAVGGSIVDAGPVGTVFCWVADRTSGRLVDASRPLPGPLVDLSSRPTRGQVATVRLARDPLTIDRRGSAVRVRGSLDDVAVDLAFEAPPADAVTAICPVAGGHRAALNVTQKALAPQVTGTVSVAGRSRTLADGVGLLDHTHGLLARETRWRWAMGVGAVDGELAGFNLVWGFNDGLENVVWLDGEPRAVGPATLEYPDHPGSARGGRERSSRERTGERAWQAITDDGSVTAELAVEAERLENVTVGPFASQYRQPLGSWDGRLDDHELEDAFGVAEVHRARW
ncbi:DUF2804 family protein [Natronobeatus ordinarius]|uniref:DUF2804 family protein n=1 Tax=Natronobeatus ordinarius TaxID=2963433 RepID=UPI0020CD0765|nr:DUF2804 family protein [Natronobeatus ordinarius]